MSRALRYRPAQRLTSAGVSAVLQQGVVCRARGIVLRCARNDLGYARLALAVPKQLLERAVDRNRVRRILREWFRHRQSRIGASDILIRIDASFAEPAALTAELDRLLQARQ